MTGRRVRIDFDEYDSFFSGCYALFLAMGYQEVSEYNREMSKATREQTITERRMRVVQSKIEDKVLLGQDPALEDLQLEEELIKKQESIEKRISSTVIKTLKSKFQSGMVFDVDEKKTREMSEEDLVQFDINILFEMVNLVLGNTPKKK